MNMGIKKFQKIIFTALIVVNLFTPLIAQADLTCSSLNDPAQTKDYIVTIIEESLGSTQTTTQDQGGILDCVRQTDCTKPADKPKCESTYVGIGECTPGSGITCQRIQALYAASGAGVLYIYIAQIYRWAAIVIGSVSVLFMVVGGIQIATAGDNSENLNKAKERIIQSIAGLVLLFLSAVILYTINPNFFTIT